MHFPGNNNTGVGCLSIADGVSLLLLYLLKVSVADEDGLVASSSLAMVLLAD